MSNTTPKKTLIVIVFNIDQTFIGFFNFLANSMYILLDNGL